LINLLFAVQHSSQKNCFYTFGFTKKIVFFVAFGTKLFCLFLNQKKKVVLFEAATATEPTSFGVESANNTKHSTPSNHNFPASKSAAQVGNYLALALLGYFQSGQGNRGIYCLLLGGALN